MKESEKLYNVLNVRNMIYINYLPERNILINLQKIIGFTKRIIKQDIKNYLYFGQLLNKELGGLVC